MLLEILERRLLFRCRPDCGARPDDLGLDYAETWADTPDGRRLHCWHIPGDTRPELTWLWFGGMGGDLSRRVNEFAAIRRYTGASIFAFDYAGFGRSPGKASVRNTAIDARAARAHLQKRYGANMESVLYLGVSLGAAVAVRLAAEGPSPAGMALVAPFASLRDMGRLLYPALTLGGRLAGGRFDSLAHIGRIGCPLLILHGADDALVPAAQGRKLYAAARPPRQFAECPGVGHDNIGDAPEFWEALCGWVDNLAAAGAGTPVDWDV